MATKKITELVEIISAANDDVLPIVDISTDITNKIKVENLPISTSVQTALNGKENTIGYTTENVANKSTSVATDQASNTKYPSVKALYDWAVGLFATISQLATKQDTLVSGTNIKTINSTSLLGTGNISIQANPSGVAGAIQFSDGSAFASDAANLFWDNSNKRLGIGTNTPTQTLQVKTANTGDVDLVNFTNGNNANTARFKANGSVILGASSDFAIESGQYGRFRFGLSVGTLSAPSARLQVVGSGSTSATTALLVQNSAGTELFKITDNGATTTRSTLFFSLSNAIIDGEAWYRTASNQAVNLYGDGAASSGVRVTGSTFSNGASQIQIKGSTSISSALNQSDASAQLDVQSTTKGFLPPRGTNAQMLAIASPAAGLIFYDLTNNKLNVFDGTSWVATH